ncbi:MAG: cytochrome c-type biogenesis protein CcmH [Gammaproteobacteria bacterium]|nr:cytochrome c-type biogenesis protein CcmH [Gammaproteobacteria bacterium]
MMRRFLFVLIAAWAVCGTVAVAKEAAPMIRDPEIAGRMAHLTQKLRCLVCQGQSVADSGSDFSNDIRREVEKLMEEGKSDQEVIGFLVQRYGDFILFEPPVKSTTAPLWIGPFVLMALGGAVLVIVLAKRAKRPVEELSPEQVAAAERLLNDLEKEGKDS